MNDNGNLLLEKSKKEKEKPLCGTGTEGLLKDWAGIAPQGPPEVQTQKEELEVCVALNVIMTITNSTKLIYWLVWLNSRHKLPDIGGGTHISRHKIVFISYLCWHSTKNYETLRILRKNNNTLWTDKAIKQISLGDNTHG